jgi:plasmid stabilization system protein ParE
MAFKIVWTPEALNTYLGIINYLEEHWTEKEIKNFVQRVESKLILLKTFPSIGSPFDKKKNLRKTLVHEKVQLYYRVKTVNKQVELISFWNTSQNPKALRKLK